LAEKIAPWPDYQMVLPGRQIATSSCHSPGSILKRAKTCSDQEDLPVLTEPSTARKRHAANRVTSSDDIPSCQKTIDFGFLNGRAQGKDFHLKIYSSLKTFRIDISIVLIYLGISESDVSETEETLRIQKCA
jgi:hypothetical protein